MLNRRIFGLPVAVILAVVATALVLLIVFNLGSIANGLWNAGEDVLEFIFRPDQRMGDAELIDCADSAGCSIVYPLIFSGLLLFVIVTGFAYTTLLERKLIAYFQNRVGPNRVGPGGFLQPAADGVKLIFKENILPTGANVWVYRMAPILKVLPTLVVLAVIPLGPPINVPWFDGNWYRVPLGLIDPDVGILWLLAITSIGTYGVALAGWSSANKYSMLGALRASAQMVSYELSMGLALAVPVLIAGSMSIGEIVQDQSGFFVNWYVFQNPLAAAILIIALIAETNRAPFDLPEAEQELTAGYMTEYSGMKFALFMMAEYLGMIAVSMIAAVTFFGGYQDGFGLVDSIPVLGPLVMMGKVVLMLIGFIWIRATLPRLRYDRLMSLGWKIMLPLAIIAVLWTAVAVIVGEEFGEIGYAIASAVMILILAGLFYIGVARPEGDQLIQEEDYEDDPMITGERMGIGFAFMNVVGGLIAIPFVLFDATLAILDGLAAFGRDPDPVEEPEAELDDSSALPAESSGD